MRKSQRVSRHLHYDTYHLKGLKVYKQDEQVADLPGSIKSGLTNMSQVDEAKSLEVEILSVTDDINDFIDENSIDDLKHNVADMDAAIQRMEDFRSIFREKHRRLFAHDQTVAQKFQQSADVMLGKIKKHIATVKELRKGIRSGEFAAASEQIKGNRRYFDFLNDEMIKQISDLKGEVLMNPAEFDDDDLLTKKSQIDQIQKRIDTTWNKISEMMKMNIDDFVVRDIQEKHSELVQLKNEYVDSLHTEYNQREIKKKETFKRSNLSISLAKFSGYDSPIDIYTFQSDFEKIHLKDVPTDSLPAMLKSKYLADPALSLVKTVDNIDELWKRLKQAYGSPKVLLKKKFQELNSVDSASRSKDFGKNELWISKIITVMKDLAKLATDHNIEGMLYNGDGIDKVMKIIGENRVTRWLTKECADDGSEDEDEDFETKNKESWKSLIVFLEKELKITQKKALIFQSPSEKYPAKGKGENDKGNFHSGDNDPAIPGSNDPAHDLGSICSLCGSKDHFKTTGPRRCILIQYYACEAFAKMTPAERFKELRKKGLCFQCLYPGADWNSGKHKEGKCQKIFSCKHASHEAHARSKHVLVCEEHKDTSENQELLKTYKEKCILKNSNAPSFSKDLQLSYHSNSSDEEEIQEGNSLGSDEGNQDNSDSEEVVQDHNSESESQNSGSESQDPFADDDEPDESAFILQTIEINHEQFVIFYDSGCGKFLTRYAAIQRLPQNRKCLTRPPPLTLGGIGGARVESKYGEYKVSLPTFNGEDAVFKGACLDQVTEEFPQYPLQGAVEEDIRTAYRLSGGDVEDLPRFPQFVGGHVDFMWGMRYNHRMPDEKFRTITGLSIYESKFKNPDGSRGVIGGNHHV